MLAERMSNRRRANRLFPLPIPSSRRRIEFVSTNPNHFRSARRAAPRAAEAPARADSKEYLDEHPQRLAACGAPMLTASCCSGLTSAAALLVAALISLSAGRARRGARLGQATGWRSCPPARTRGWRWTTCRCACTGACSRRGPRGPRRSRMSLSRRSCSRT